jgi:TonB family protein
MILTAMAFTLCLVVHAPFQSPSFEKQALAMVQKMAASDLDSKLPNSPFAVWFSQSVGPRAGIVWQLTACGEDIGAQSDGDRDLPACAQVNATLPDGRKVIAVVAVGTFKRGFTGEPVFFRAILELDNQIYLIPRLSELPKMLSEPERVTVTLPAIALDQRAVTLSVVSKPAVLSLLPNRIDREKSEAPSLPLRIESRRPQKASEITLQGKAITKVRPIYPATARRMNAQGAVEVQVTISEKGRVIEAVAISGHNALRSAAVTAARGWVFNPTILRGVPIKDQRVLTFIFVNEYQ